ncbi:hypothetical protein N9Z02_00525 [Akkermansiaceae bacterium]|nr:hypothetical protein [Akkermansiaceae bacterium]
MMKEQAGIYQEMASVLQELAADGHSDDAEAQLREQVLAFQANRSAVAALPKPNEKEQLALASLPDLSDGHKAFFEAQSAYFSSEHSSPKISDILSGLHESAPVAGEGRP